jgi:hypothetical protein
MAEAERYGCLRLSECRLPFYRQLAGGGLLEEASHADWI